MNYKQTRLQTQEVLNDTYADLMSEYMKSMNMEFKQETTLSEDQQRAFELFKKGENILMLGAGGCGKSICIKTIENYIKTNKDKLNKNIYLCSTTGISAYNIGGMTIHSFLGIGTGEQNVEILINRIKKNKIYANRIKNIDIIVIDEISMLSAELFEKINIVCQVIRKNNVFFGGIQVVLSADFLQLLPIFNKNAPIYKNKEIDDRLIIESPVFLKEFKKNVIILEKNFRQENDSKFSDLLLRVRNGTITEEDIVLLNTRKNLKHSSNIINLVSSNKKAQIINNENLQKINEKEYKYVSKYNCQIKNEITELIKKELQFQFTQKGLENLILKKGLRVMLIKNLDVELGLVNGSIGTIIDFTFNQKTNTFEPIIEFDNGIKHTIGLVDWELEVDGFKCKATQVPLMLAYAITTHRSQSLTLESAVLDLADAFTDAMVYVALSRVRTLDGVYLKSFDHKKIIVNSKMKNFVENISKK